ncbi:MAG: hypothetical protein RBT11_05495 [Desulfobacterales bacterium]|nr:hypothetical protein [Desulfobacterales bacterium]
MIRNVWSILCKDIIIDQETNAVTFIQSIEEGAAAALPILISPVRIGTLWEKDSNKDEVFTARVLLAMPSGAARQLLQTREMVFNRQRQRLHFKLDGVPVTEFGRHEVRIEIQQNGNWQTVSRLPVVVRKLKPREQVAPA